MYIISRVLALIIILLISTLLAIIGWFIYIDDGFPVLFKQQRVGKDNRLFHIFKFRTMLKNTPEVASHLLEDTAKYFTKSGPFIRKMSLD